MKRRKASGHADRSSGCNFALQSAKGVEGEVPVVANHRSFHCSTVPSGPAFQAMTGSVEANATHSKEESKVDEQKPFRPGGDTALYKMPGLVRRPRTFYPAETRH